MIVLTFAAAQATAQQSGMQSGSGRQSQASDQKAGGTGQSGQQGTTGQMSTGGQRADQQEAAKISRASELMDKKVQNQQGQDLGQVEDLVIGQDGSISYIIVSQGGVMGIGDKLTPIPFRNAQLSPQQDAVILSNIDKQKLQNAPTIAQGEWERLTDPGFEREVFSYYGQPSGQGRMQQSPGQGPTQQQRPGQGGR
jgi:sporulation protein YlmC with PRC-barrel domain